MSRKPVEIEYLMKDKVSPGLGDIARSSVSMGKTLTEVSDNIKAKLEEQKAVVKLVENDLKALEKQHKKMAPGGAWAEMKAEIEACKKALDEEKVSLAAIEQEHDKAATSTKRLSRELTQMQDAMARMRLEGKQLSPEYAELEQKAALLADTLADVRAQTNILSHDNAGLQGAISGVTGLTGAITTGVGIMGVFTKNNEDLVKVQTRVQSVMAITMGMQQVMNTLNKDSAFRLVTVKRAKEGLAAANLRLATTLGISAVAAKVLMATLTLGLSVALGAAIALWDRFRSKQAKAREEAEEFNKAVADMAAQSVVDFKKMTVEWERLGDSLEDKEKYVRDNQEAFKKLGVSINDAAEADNLFTDGAAAFVESIKLRARAAAAMDLAAEKYKEALRKMEEAEKMSDTKTRYYMGEGDSGSYEVENKKKTRLLNQIEEIEAEVDFYIDKHDELTKKRAEVLAGANITTTETIIDGSVAAIEKVIASKQELLKKATSAVDYNKIQREIEAEQRKLRAITGAGNKAAETTEKVTNNLAELELRARQRIEDQALALRQEGYDKERAAAELHFDREKARIEKEEADRLALYEKLLRAGEAVSPQERQVIVDQVAEQMDQAEKLYSQALEGINKKQLEDQQDTFRQLLEPYKTYAEKRLDIERQYNEDIEKLRAGGASDENIANAERARDRTVAELDATMGSTTDFWARLFDTFSHYTNKELQEVIGNAQEVLDYLNSTSMEEIGPKFGLSAEQLRNLKGNATELTAIYDALGEKIQQMNGRDPFGAIIRGQKMLRRNAADIRIAQQALDRAQASGDRAAIKGAQERLDSLKRYESLLKGSLKDAVNAGISYLGDLGDSFQQIGEAAGDAGLASFGKALSEVTGIAAQFASGDYIGAAVSAITTGLTAIFSSKAKYRAALRQMQDDQVAFAHQYRLVLSDIRLEAEEASNAFGEDSFARAIAALKELHTNYEDFVRLVNKDEGVKSGGTSILADLKRARQEAKGITTDLQNIWIQTRHKTLFRSAKGSYLKDLYPELFGGEHGFDVEAARVLLETNNQLNDEAKRQIQEVIDLYDQWKEAEEQFREYLTETFGDVGNSLADSIVSAFKSGTDAMEEWGQSFNTVLENLGKQMMQTIFLQKHFDQLEQDITDIYENYGDDPNKIAQKIPALLGRFFGQMGDNVQQAADWYEWYAQEAKKAGFDLSGSDSDAQQSAKAGAFTAMSQEMGGELKGLFVSVQMRLGDIYTKMDELGPGLDAIGGLLAEIRDNTGRSADFAKKILERIETMIREGLKMK